ncbi:MAG: CPBP family glutamic-type intramembrane protease [Planctomycetota bacterium]
MSQVTSPSSRRHTGQIVLAGRFDRLAETRPDLPLIAPFMAYLAVWGLVYVVPPALKPAAIAARGLVSLAAVWVFRRHLPPWGRAHWGIAIVGGAVAAWGWVYGQHVFDNLGVGGRLPLMPGELVDPRIELGADDLFWTTWWLRMLVAITAVPVVEEIFWRGFLLRALIDWHNFERIPLGKFTWFSFIGTSLVSTLQHPSNWGVSILCWMGFNAAFYWTRSLLCLVLLHACTNLFLYVMVLRVGDWSFW